MSIITIEHLTKEFRLGQLQGLGGSIRHQLGRLAGRRAPPPPMFRALDDVSFTIEAGEVVGIIGHNGAGKSTLLKLISNITAPSAGRIRIAGRVAPLIEVGAGFVPELTGRENVYLNGAILGLSRREVDRQFDDIVEFAEMAPFIDTPVKRYSSGMKVKLAFAVATSVEAEILIVDEVLAVGDLAFQRKCFDRMESFIKHRGHTVLLVSHNIRQVVRMCDRVMMLDQGRVVADGEPLQVAERFYAQSNKKIQDHQLDAARLNGKVRSSGEIDLLEVGLVDAAGVAIDQVRSGDPLRVRVRLELNQALPDPEIVVGTHTTDFFYLTAGSTATLEHPPQLRLGVNEIDCLIPSFPMVAGTYCVRLAVFDGSGRMVLAGETLAVFQVTPPADEAHRPPLRNLHLPTAWVVNEQSFEERG
ncbi:ABC transporter ATP-binding protein [Marichromatium bheemlicum]|uniref:ABC transporter ATP-binding protein n=1 Tax=Marichromatium bheemlicum TaxID=365339 RepID=A0ABX1IAJ6_9GAMM|nr:ABC transporter ATP-binding protein [Marichromatium bheemlicum]NKN33385.1 ABC transporter ATP-binding protein [Marichromatium bheemlicum]